MLIWCCIVKVCCALRLSFYFCRFLGFLPVVGWCRQTDLSRFVCASWPYSRASMMMYSTYALLGLRRHISCIADVSPAFPLSHMNQGTYIFFLAVWRLITNSHLWRRHNSTQQLRELSGVGIADVTLTLT